MMRATILFGTMAAGLALTSCMSNDTRSRMAAAQAGVEQCRSQKFPSAVARAQCIQRAADIARPTAGSASDLYDVGAKKSIVLAEKVDRREITQAQADLEMAQTIAALNSTAQQRDAIAKANAPRSCTSQMVFGVLQTTCD